MLSTGIVYFYGLCISTFFNILRNINFQLSHFNKIIVILKEK